jgi:hypothetical protein
VDGTLRFRKLIGIDQPQRIAEDRRPTITGNGADGIRVETLSGVRFQGAPSTVTGNTGIDLVCDSDTYVAVSGESPAIGKTKGSSF